MDSVSNPVIDQMKLKDRVYASELLTTFHHFAPHIKILSLDCFDTLLFRKTTTPIDVFFDLQHYPTFQSLGFNALMRVQAEEKARKIKVIQKKVSEVTLEEIYKAYFPTLTTPQIEQLREEELRAEFAACYAFPPTVELIRTAAARGIKIMIVSDTYFSEKELHRLLAHHLPKDVMLNIQNIFCSSVWGRSKSQGLFKKILTQLKILGNDILHIGDHPNADYLAPRTHKINTIQLVHQHEMIEELLRMHAVSANLTHPAYHDSTGSSSPFKGVLANTATTTITHEYLIGYASLGPILYAFSKFLLEEIEQLTAAGKNPKVIFLMRDAYLPYLTSAALLGKSLGTCVRISRFAAFAASFRTKKDVELYLIDVLTSGRFHDIAHQLLLPQGIADTLINTVLKSQDPVDKFAELILQKNNLQIIFNKSAEYRTRLIRHLEKAVGLQQGDTLVFVDLGYTGTAQIKLAPIFQDEMHVEIIGRYLIALTTPGWKTTRKGLLDPSWCDERILHMIVAYVALLEQMCTTSEASIIDYDKNGDPILSEANLEEQQHIKLKLIQSECVRFVQDAEKFFQATRFKPSVSLLRETAMIELNRLLYLPTKTEIDYLKSFKFDLNLGTTDTFHMFDQTQGLIGLKKRGIFSLFMERNRKTFRTNVTAELRSAGLELAITMMANHRYGFNLNVKDMSLRREALDIIITQGEQFSKTSIEAIPTHDGYFSLWIPIGIGQFNIGILFGQKYHWVQLESAELIVAKAFLTYSESQYTTDCWHNIAYHQMNPSHEKLYECQSIESFMLFTPSATMPPDQNKYVLRVVFRPITNRG